MEGCGDRPHDSEPSHAVRGTFGSLSLVQPAHSAGTGNFFALSLLLSEQCLCAGLTALAL